MFEALLRSSISSQEDLDEFEDQLEAASGLSERVQDKAEALVRLGGELSSA